ncbi:MAG TPA: DUF1343 domain-containing protein [Caldithrix abyssi]|uniref:DUF1343 domain-containing protein n=1 Tax=Caldithrix abyssi TaxID=187145 RepID=A0A7V4U181_CALAY|nr:DUF1343 domain-containing protein [Caldithrix abyssi]
MNYLFVVLSAALFFIMPGCSPSSPTVKKTVSAPMVQLGNENFLQNYLHLTKNKRVGILTNPSGVDRNLVSIVDILHNRRDINVTALFAPEHGIRGDYYAGSHVENQRDERTGLPVYSLYGDSRKPGKDMLENVDAIIVDIQDIGLRPYTYVYTMAMVMQAAAEFGKEVIVLDRPNPIGGVQVEGNPVQEGYFSFVGLYPVPYRHGMTIGELAKLFNEEYDIHCRLTVVPVLNWRRRMHWDQTGLPWVAPSPHVPTWETILQMISTGAIGELQTVSVGVGYTLPFKLIGAPWMDGQRFADALNRLDLPGVRFRPLFYKPFYSLFKGELCQGVQLHITDRNAYRPYHTGLMIMRVLLDQYPQQNIFAGKDRRKMFDKVVGCSYIANDLLAGKSVAEIEAKWQQELADFMQIRQKYLLY